MLQFNLNKNDYQIAIHELNNGLKQTHLYNNSKLYLVRNAYNQLVCNRVLQNDLTKNNLGVTKDCCILNKWAF
jgi:hypothetical protein